MATKKVEAVKPIKAVTPIKEVKAEPAKAEVKETVKAEPVKAVAKAEVKAPKKETAKKAAPKKETVKKAAPKKETVKKTAEKKTAAKKTGEEKSCNFYLQYAGKQFGYEEIIEKAKEAAAAEMGKTTASVKSIDIYCKPEEHAAYYVVANKKIAGRIDL